MEVWQLARGHPVLCAFLQVCHPDYGLSEAVSHPRKNVWVQGWRPAQV